MRQMTRGLRYEHGLVSFVNWLVSQINKNLKLKLRFVMNCGLVICVPCCATCSSITAFFPLLAFSTILLMYSNCFSRTLQRASADCSFESTSISTNIYKDQQQIHNVYKNQFKPRFIVELLPFLLFSVAGRLAAGCLCAEEEGYCSYFRAVWENWWKCFSACFLSSSNCLIFSWRVFSASMTPVKACG